MTVYLVYFLRGGDHWSLYDVCASPEAAHRRALIWYDLLKDSRPLSAVLDVRAYEVRQ